MYELEDNDNLVENWAKVYMLWVPQCNLDFLLDEVMPTLLPLHSLKEKLSQRILSGDMLLEICSVYGEEAFNKEQKLLSFTFSTCEDINWKIRKLGANRLRRIIEKSKKILKERQDVYNNFNEKLEELMTDEENFVKIDAFETIVHWIPYFKHKDIEERFVPRIKEIFEKEVVDHEEMVFPIASFWGELLCTLNKHDMPDWLKNEVAAFYESLLEHENEELRRRAAYNLPFFFTELYVDNAALSDNSSEGNDKAVCISKEKWEDYIQKLAHDEYDEIRNIVAGCFHEIWLKVTEDNRELGSFKKLLFEFLEDENEHVMISIVKNLPKYMEIYHNELPASNDYDDVDSNMSEEIKQPPLVETKTSDRLKPGNSYLSTNFLGAPRHKKYSNLQIKATSDSLKKKKKEYK